MAQSNSAPTPVPATASVDTTHLDVAVLAGVLSSDPVRTELPSGSVLVRYEVTVRDRTPADSVPVSWLDPRRPPSLRAGDGVVVVGRVRRRFFRAGGVTRSATEVVASSVRRSGSTRDAHLALADAMALLGGGC